MKKLLAIITAMASMQVSAAAITPDMYLMEAFVFPVRERIIDVPPIPPATTVTRQIINPASIHVEFWRSDRKTAQDCYVAEHAPIVTPIVIMIARCIGTTDSDFTIFNASLKKWVPIDKNNPGIPTVIFNTQTGTGTNATATKSGDTTTVTQGSPVFD